MQVNFKHKGNFNRLEKFLTRAVRLDIVIRTILKRYGEKGVQLLREATPKDTGKTAESWSYELVKNENGWSIVWKNDNINNGQNIAILLQYGHATRNGGFVQGIDYINPPIKKLFGEMADEAWKEVAQHGRNK